MNDSEEKGPRENDRVNNVLTALTIVVLFVVILIIVRCLTN